MAWATPRIENTTTGHAAGRFFPRNHPPMLQQTTIPMISAPSENHLMPSVDGEDGVVSFAGLERVDDAGFTYASGADAERGLSGRGDGLSVPATGEFSESGKLSVRDIYPPLILRSDQP